jgi:hypothetical protein
MSETHSMVWLAWRMDGSGGPGGPGRPCTDPDTARRYVETTYLDEEVLDEAQTAFVWEPASGETWALTDCGEDTGWHITTERVIGPEDLPEP